MKAKSSKYKKPPEPKFDPDAVLARLMDLAAPQPDEIPDGYKTAKDWASSFGLSLPRTHVLLAAGIEANEWERHRFRNNGRSVFYFRCIKRP